MYTKTCSSCNQDFDTHKGDATKCYSCHLKSLSGGGCPEEGDFNTAALLSGRLSPQEEREFQQELCKIDHSDVADEYEARLRDYEDFYTDPCPKCGAPHDFD